MADSTPIGSRELTRAWHGVLGRLELELNPHNFATWLNGTRPIRLDGDCLLVEARSPMTCEWLNQRLRVVVERAAAQAFHNGVTVRFIPPGATPSDESPAPEGPAVPPRGPAAIGTINCKFTFEEYQQIEGNELALRACKAIAENSGFAVSPVVIFGSPGMGKTHLLHALACSAQAAGRRVACLNAEEFANRFLNALRDGQSNAFQEQIREVDLLIIDDLQAIATKKATLDQLVHSMEEVTNRGGSVVIASERSPFELGLPDRLESRLAAGIVTRVDPFLVEEQRPFVEAVTRRRRVSLPGWAIERISGCRASSVRVLLGFVNGALALHDTGKLTLASLDARLGASAIVESAPEQRQKAVLERVASYFEVAVDDLRGRGRTPRLNDARAVAIAALQEGGFSLSELKDAFSGRDKSTLHGLRERGKQIIEADETLRAAIAS